MELDICVPYWGDPEQFLLTIASVQAQTDPHWRLTVIDDCYPDARVADHITALADPRITYRRNERNVGITENFRRAVAAAIGSHVVVLGSDDLLLPNYVEHIRAVIAANPDIDVIQPGVQVIDGDGRPARSLTDAVKQRLLTPRRPRTMYGDELAASLLHGNWLYWPSLALRVDRVRAVGFRDELPIILDLALLIDIAFAGGSLRYTDETCFAYRRHSGSLSQTSLRDGTRFDDELRFYRGAARDAARLGWARAQRSARRRLMSRLHAVTQIPTLLRAGTSPARRAAWRLAVGR